MERKWYESAKLLDVIIDNQPEKILSYEAVAEKDLQEFPLKAVAPVEYAQLGIGCNTFSGDARSKALIADEALIAPGKIQGQEKRFYLDLIKNKHELNKKMEVSASASYSGLFSASAKSTFVNGQNLNRESVYLLVKVLVTNSRTQFKEYKPSEGFTKFIAKDPINWNQFIKKYGNQFIFSIATGGEFYALYEFHTESIQQKNSLEIHLEGKGWGFEAEGDFKKALEEIDTNVNVTCKLYIRGGKGKLPEIKDDKIIQAALDFPEAVDPESGAPVAYKAETNDYDVVDDFPGFPDYINENLNQNKDICDEIAMQLARIEDLEQSLIMQGDLDDITKKKLDDIKECFIDEMQKIVKSPISTHEEPAQLIDRIEKIEIEKAWTMIPGQALTQISVGSNQYVWGVSGDNQIWEWNSAGYNWKNISGGLMTVSVGADGTVWGVNSKASIFRRDINKWKNIKGGLKQISVGGKEHVWGINSGGQVFQWENQKWAPRTNKQTGTFNLLSVGSDGAVFLLKENYQVFKWVKEKALFEQIKGELSYISVGKASEIWGIDTKSQVVKWDGETWKPLPSARKLKSISVGDDGTVWGVDGQGNIFRLNITLLPMS